MRRCFELSLLVVLVAGSVGAQTPPKPPSDKVLEIIAALEPLLPEYGAAADRWEQSLVPLQSSTDANVRTAVDCVRLQVSSVRSVRKIIAEQPDYLTYHVHPASLTRWKDGAEYFLDCAQSGRDPFEGKTAGVRPFHSKIDDQLLLYRFSLPADYDPAKKYPLVVDLHSGGGFTWLAYWVTGKPDADRRAASTNGAIHISPAGRQHIGLGEIAILEAIADAKRHYSVDEDRVLIGGASYGGTGGFHFGTFLPDQIAAAHSLTGGGNYNVPVGNGRFDAYMLADNLANLPFLIWDAPREGHYQANHAFADGLRERAQAHRGFYPHLELTDPQGGHGIIDRALRDEGWSWMRGQTRNRFPKLVVYKTYTLRYDGAYWARIDTVEDPTQPARIEAQIEADGGCRVQIDNADRFHLEFTPQLVGAAAEVAVRVNGGDPLTAPNGRSVNFWNVDGRWRVSEQRYPEGLVKKHGVSGPIQDVFMEHPVLMVYGTVAKRSSADTTKLLDAVVDRLVSKGDGSGVLRTGFDRKADDEVNDADIAERNLILVGTPAQNRLLARIVDRLPIQYLDDGVEIAGKNYRGPGVGLVMVYPNPLNPERYVLLVPETYWGDKPWAYPDYVVLQPPADERNRPRVLTQGTFHARWKFTD